jgi:hypothetical protein
VLADIALHAQAAAESSRNYERELVLHANTVKTLETTKQQLHATEETARKLQVRPATRDFD